MMLEAMQILEDEPCKECGSQIWICRNESAAHVGFKVKIATCFAKAELDRHQEREEKKKKKNKKHGEQEYVLPYAYDGGELPTRMSYFNSLTQQAMESMDTNSV
jgi:hypothetical protein